MEKIDFQIVFEKLADAAKDNGEKADWAFLSEAARDELDEIAELRRLSNELIPPDVVCFTTT